MSIKKYVIYGTLAACGCLAFTGCTIIQRPAPERSTVAAEGRGQTAGAYVSDSWITTKVKTALVTNAIVPARRVHVVTRNRVVHLYGTVNSKNQVVEATREAQTVNGVKRVVNHLKVRSAAQAKSSS